MTGEEFDDFATLWRDEPSPEEQAELEALARQTRRRVWFMQQLEIGGGVLLLLALIAGLALTPVPAALFAGALLAAVLIWSSWRRYMLTRVALLVDTSGHETLLENAIKSTEIRLRRSGFGLWLIIPGYLLGTMTLHAMTHKSLSGFPDALWLQVSPSTRFGIITLALLGGLFGYFLRVHRGIQRELANLKDLHSQYLLETQLDEHSGH